MKGWTNDNIIILWWIIRKCAFKGPTPEYDSSVYCPSNHSFNKYLKYFKTFNTRQEEDSNLHSWRSLDEKCFSVCRKVRKLQVAENTMEMSSDDSGSQVSAIKRAVRRVRSKSWCSAFLFCLQPAACLDLNPDTHARYAHAYTRTPETAQLRGRLC